MNRKTNSTLCLFPFADPFVSFMPIVCLYMVVYYGHYHLKAYIHLIEVALNKILSKVWNLPSHTNIVHSIAHSPSISDIVFKHFLIVVLYLYLVSFRRFYLSFSLGIHFYWL